MNIEIGDRVIFEGGIVKLIYDADRLWEINQYINGGGNQILKIERPNWEVVEEKKELLTEEEREFLKDIIKFIKGRIKQIEKGLYAVYFVSEKGEQLINVERRTIFKGLEENKIYTLKELRIGGINYEKIYIDLFNSFYIWIFRCFFKKQKY